MGSDPQSTMLVAGMLRSTWTDGLVLSQVDRLTDAAKELLERGASCVLLDLGQMAEAPLDALEQLQLAAPDVAIVVLTDFLEEATAVATIRAGAQDCLVKPELNPTSLHRAVRNAIERKRSETRLAHQALHDQLTGLPNRALFLDRLGMALDRSRRTKTSVAVLFLDVDNFKDINDSMGHAAGDMLLAGLAERLRGMLRPMDTVARFGGDEFTFLFEDLDSEREVILIADRISRAAAAPIALGASEALVTVSIGIAMTADPTVPVETMIREADAAMYRAKEQGRSRYELFDEASRRRANERLELESELRHAIQRAQLRVHYQPRVSLEGDIEVVGFEALVRWQHPERGLIAPAEFISLAEETGIIAPIDQFVLEEALHQVTRWRRSEPRITVSVNISARQLEDPGLPSVLGGALRASGCPPEALCLEISERTISANTDGAARAFAALKSLGVCLALDDYGTGSSQLSSLRQMPLDMLKLDESLVGGVGTDTEQTTIVGAVVELAHALGMRVVAEGVESEDQLEQLQALGCDGAQGYLFSAAIPEDEADTLLLEG